MDHQIPADSLFAEVWNSTAESVADIPEPLKAQIRAEALVTAFHRLEASLRLLLYATTPGKEPPTPEHLHQILNVWRYELEHRISLVPDTYCGAVRYYEPEMDQSYAIDGRCQPGDRLRIRVPCWRMFERIVVRGEAERIEDAFDSEAADSIEAAPAESSSEGNARSTLDHPTMMGIPAGDTLGLLSNGSEAGQEA